MAFIWPSLTMQLTSGVDVFAHVCGQKADISSNCYDIIQLHDKRRFSLSNVTQLLDCFFFENYHKFEHLTFAKYSAAMYWNCGGNYYMSFVGNLLLFPAVKEFWKPIKKWQSYRHEFSVWDTVCRFQDCRLGIPVSDRPRTCLSSRRLPARRHTVTHFS